MKALRRFVARLAGWTGQSKRERELNEKFATHLQMQIDDNMRAGMPLEDARHMALLKIGPSESARHSMRDLWTFRWVDSLIQDVRYALRGLRRTPGFTLAATLSIALGLRASLAIFTVADNLLVRNLPYRDPSR